MKKFLTTGGSIVAIVVICIAISILGVQLYLHTTPLGRLSGRVTVNETEIAQLKCTHPTTSYFRQDSLGVLCDPIVYNVDDPPYTKPEFCEVCDSCSKVMRELTQLEYLILFEVRDSCKSAQIASSYMTPEFRALCDLLRQYLSKKIDRFCDLSDSCRMAIRELKEVKYLIVRNDKGNKKDS